MNRISYLASHAVETFQKLWNWLAALGQRQLSIIVYLANPQIPHEYREKDHHKSSSKWAPELEFTAVIDPVIRVFWLTIGYLSVTIGSCWLPLFKTRFNHLFLGRFYFHRSFRAWCSHYRSRSSRYSNRWRFYKPRVRWFSKKKKKKNLCELRKRGSWGEKRELWILRLRYSNCLLWCFTRLRSRHRDHCEEQTLGGSRKV